MIQTVQPFYYYTIDILNIFHISRVTEVVQRVLEAGAGAEVGHLEQDGAVAGLSLGLGLGLVVAPGVGGAGQVGVPQPGVEQPRPQLRPALGLGLWCRQPRDVEAGMVRGRLVAGQR